jgi:hypothetical protein
MLQNALPRLLRLNEIGGGECSDSKNPIGRTFSSGNRIFAETGKSRLSVPARRSAVFRHAGVKPGPVAGELHCNFFNALSTAS